MTQNAKIPFISPFTLTTTPALSTKKNKKSSNLVNSTSKSPLFKRTGDNRHFITPTFCFKNFA